MVGSLFKKLSGSPWTYVVILFILLGIAAHQRNTYKKQVVELSEMTEALRESLTLRATELLETRNSQLDIVETVTEEAGKKVTQRRVIQKEQSDIKETAKEQTQVKEQAVTKTELSSTAEESSGDGRLGLGIEAAGLLDKDLNLDWEFSVSYSILGPIGVVGGVVVPHSLRGFEAAKLGLRLDF
jgi:hypothetical protein